MVVPIAHTEHTNRVVLAARRCGLLLVVVACEGEQPAPMTCPTPELVFDPFEHAVCVERCFDALDCTRGTICVKKGDATHGRCVLPSETLETSRSALLDGFGVPIMSADLEDMEELALVWSRPAGARLVQCALLACPPAFRTPYGEGEGPDAQWSDPADGGRVVIANYDRCALASETSTQPAGSFNLRERGNQHKPGRGFEAPEPDEHCQGYGCAPITELFVGCWAYDDVSVVAASRLFRVDLDAGIFSYERAFAPADGCRSTEDAFRTCVIDHNNNTLGVCTTGGECVRPCRTDCDCADDAETQGCHLEENVQAALRLCDAAKACTVPIGAAP